MSKIPIDFHETSCFPPPESGDEYGVVALTYSLNCEMLEDAYYHGIFPWPWDNRFIPWVSPAMRGVLPMEAFHIPKSLKRELKKNRFHFRMDSCFEQVIEACAASLRNGEKGTWITPKMLGAYKKFFKKGHVHSFEAFNDKDELVGGLYGVRVGAVFCGESMFFRESGASKAAFCYAYSVFKEWGIQLIDTQEVTNLTALFGAFEIPRDDYLKRLKELRDIGTQD